jgi:hypothetical protein
VCTGFSRTTIPKRFAGSLPCYLVVMGQLSEFVTTGEAARILKRSEDTVRRFDASGILPARRASNGVRVFERVRVELLAEQLAAQREERSAR